MLFSEPKIPQFLRRGRRRGKRVARFSALQRAENSSIGLHLAGVIIDRISFSALQRAENSSVSSTGLGSEFRFVSFSALQRAENSSITIR